MFLKSHISPITTVLSTQATDDVQNGGTSEYNYLLIFCLD